MGKQWDEVSFFEELTKRKGDDVAAVARTLLDWGKARANDGLRVWWGRGKQSGSFFLMVDHDGRTDSTIAVWTYGSVDIQFQHLARNPDGHEGLPFASESARLELLNRCNAIPGVTISNSGINRRPSIPLEAFLLSERRQQLVQVLDWLVDRHLGRVSEGDLNG